MEDRYAQDEGMLRPEDDSFKVVIRVRPPLHRELHDWRPFQNTVDVDASQTAVTVSENIDAHRNNAGGVCNGLLYATQRFTFDHVFTPHAAQHEVYQRAAQPAVASTLQGYNATIIAYGQTGTGKTYTMEGAHDDDVHQGIVPRAIKDIFSHISADQSAANQYLVRASYLQIYNEVISDLLKEDRTNLTIREDKRRGVYVEKLSEWVVRSEDEILQLMAKGAQNRTTGATKLNDVSSRSHAVFVIIVEQSTSQQAAVGQNLSETVSQSRHLGMAAAMPVAPVSVKVGKLNLVDLAGSERVHVTGATGKRLAESKSINQSLSALGKVIAALTDRKSRQHIPYRDSKLTRFLEDSLGGNCKTTMMCMVSPALDAFAESVSTLKFANRAKCIRNRAEVNEDLDHRTLLRRYERELKKLRTELQTRSQQLVDKRHLLQIDEQRRRAEADKLAAITELETRSQEFMREKCEKLALERKIADMQGQMLIGGSAVQVTPAIQNMLEKEQKKVRSEYESRFRELERERVAIQDDKAKMEVQGELILKQRDIMRALTTKLSDRDEQILILQKELDAYDRAQRSLEDALDQRTAEIMKLRKAALEQMETSPGRANELQSALGAWGGKGEELPTAASLGDDSASIPALHGGGAVEADRSSHEGSSAASDIDAGAGSRIAPAMEQEREAHARAVAAFQAQQLGLEQQNQRLQRQVETLSQQEVEHLQHLEEETQSHEKERSALKIILQSKMHVCVGQILEGVAQLQEEGVIVPGKVSKQARALQNLIGATVQAIGGAGDE